MFGVAGPGWLSTQPVRCGLPRAVGQSAREEKALTAVTQRHRAKTTQSFHRVFKKSCNRIQKPLSVFSSLCLCASVVDSWFHSKFSRNGCSVTVISFSRICPAVSRTSTLYCPGGNTNL